MTLDGLLRDWQYFVGRVERGFTANVYEYGNDLSARDLIQDVIEQATPSLRASLSEFLEPIDTQFRSATKRVPKPIMRQAAGRDRWWWSRVPTTLVGELASDLEADLEG